MKPSRNTKRRMLNYRFQGAFFVAVALCLFVSSARAYEGAGTAGDPYRITSGAEMNQIGLNTGHWNSHFKLMNDISLSAYTGTQYNIIGNTSTKFTGVFDGDGHTISNFTYTSPDVTGVDIGLFGYVQNAEIKHLGLINPNLHTDATEPEAGVGMLVGYVKSGTISDSYAAGGSITGEYYTAGLVGVNAGTITNSYASVDVHINAVVADADTEMLEGVIFERNQRIGKSATCIIDADREDVQVPFQEELGRDRPGTA